MALVQTTLLFLQNTKITVSTVLIFNYAYTHYIMQNKAMQQYSSNKCEARLFYEIFFLEQ